MIGWGLNQVNCLFARILSTTSVNLSFKEKEREKGKGGMGEEGGKEREREGGREE